ncbi:MAG: substrate-binding domain-containing protein [Vibrio litoralis]|uniref:substrate-binding domain-containing protein n=1 Tax=Vibrio litoralis TaxID=335972 RepID=UPI003F98CDAC
MKMRFWATALLCLATLVPTANAQDTKTIRLATTTSTYHSGLLDYLLPKFKIETGYTIDVIAVGTGKALKMGENGDVDLVMTHAPGAEAEFINQGFGVEPHHLMYNDFVIVGPKNDPAGIKDEKSAAKALKTLADKNITFVSRGDDSGTDKKEKAIWKQDNIQPSFSAYRSVGQGMGPTLNMASELQGYTLTDRGTWIAYESKLDLEIMVEGDKALFNPYQVILVNPERYNGLNTRGARDFSNWLISKHGQQLINDYQLQGQKLFTASYDGK